MTHSIASVLAALDIAPEATSLPTTMDGAAYVLVLWDRSTDRAEVLTAADRSAAETIAAESAFGSHALRAVLSRDAVSGDLIMRGVSWALVHPEVVSQAKSDRGVALRAAIGSTGASFTEWTGNIVRNGAVGAPGAVLPSDLSATRFVMMGWVPEDRAVSVELLEGLAHAVVLAERGRWDATIRLGLVDLDTGADVEVQVRAIIGA
jgi:hypothetical protein